MRVPICAQRPRACRRTGARPPARLPRRFGTQRGVSWARLVRGVQPLLLPLAPRPRRAAALATARDVRRACGSGAQRRPHAAREGGAWRSVRVGVWGRPSAALTRLSASACAPRRCAVTSAARVRCADASALARPAEASAHAINASAAPFAAALRGGGCRPGAGPAAHAASAVDVDRAGVAQRQRRPFVLRQPGCDQRQHGVHGRMGRAAGVQRHWLFLRGGHWFHLVLQHGV